MSAKNKKSNETEKDQNKPLQEDAAQCEAEVPNGTEPETVSEAAAPDETAALRRQLDDCSDKLMRTLAEYDNYRKRSQREKTEVYPDAVAATVTKLLPVLDNFERALGTECADADFKKGVEMIFANLSETLKAMGVQEIEAAGQQFDPNLHNAVMHIEDEAIGENVVAQVMQKGYQLGDRILRHAMVQVAN